MISTNSTCESEQLDEVKRVVQRGLVHTQPGYASSEAYALEDKVIIGASELREFHKVKDVYNFSLLWGEEMTYDHYAATDPIVGRTLH